MSGNSMSVNLQHVIYRGCKIFLSGRKCIILHPMESYNLKTDNGCGEVRAVRFAPQGGVAEYNIMIRTSLRGSFSQQLESIRRSFDEAVGALGCDGAEVMFGRWFLSDAVNQVPELPERFCGRRLSAIQQAPLDGSKVALWLWLAEGAERRGESLKHGAYEHLWFGADGPAGCDSGAQSRCLIEKYVGELAQHGCRLTDDCIRTWFFVRDVDNNYGGLVRARREYFDSCGLTSETHYIASTGIEGGNSVQGSLVTLDAYAVKGLAAEQITYLHARRMLSRTSDYGVTFERGTAVSYGDRRHVFISGTASIDHRGEVLHVGDVRGQVLRMWANIEALLAEAGARMSDIESAIVYLRDSGDRTLVARMFAERFPELPYVMVLAPVCRPTWLVEMECLAAVEVRDDRFAAF